MSEYELELQETNDKLRRQVQKLTVDQSQTRREAIDATAQRDRAQRSAVALLLDCEAKGRAMLADWEGDHRSCVRDIATAALRSVGARRGRGGGSRSTTPQPSSRGYEDPHSLGVAGPRHHRTGSRGQPGSPSPQQTPLSIALPPAADALTDKDDSILPSKGADDAGASPSDDDFDSSDEPSMLSSPQTTAAKPAKPRRPACTITNPNAFGDPVGGPKNKNWYLCEALRQSMIVHMSREHNRVTARAPGPVSPPRVGQDDDSDDAPEKDALGGSGAFNDSKNPAPAPAAKSGSRFGLRGFLPSRVAAALPLGRKADVAAALDTEESYLVCIKQDHVHCKIGLEDAGYLGPANDDITSRALRSRFGLDERPSGEAAPTSPAAVSPPTPVSRKGPRDYRPDEIAITFHAEDHMRRVRSALEVTTDYVSESCGCRASHWRVVHSPGKSDSMFLYMGHLVAKSVNEVEFKLLTTDFLADLAPYTERNPHTLLPRFSMLFTVTWLKTKKATHFIVMDNVFRTSCFIQRIYDLKGSTVGRDGIDATTGKAAKRTPFGALLLKDNDLPERLIICGPMRRALLVAQLKSDTGFLQAHNIVDYSLLVGQRSRSIVANAALVNGGYGAGVVRHQRTSSVSASVSAAAAVGPASEAASDTPSFDPSDNIDGKCFRSHDGGMVSLPLHTSNNVGEAREDTFYMGLVDVLQPYSGAKRIETIAKSIFYDSTKISVVPPSDFATRLCVLIERISV